MLLKSSNGTSSRQPTSSSHLPASGPHWVMGHPRGVSLSSPSGNSCDSCGHALPFPDVTAVWGTGPVEQTRDVPSTCDVVLRPSRPGLLPRLPSSTGNLSERGWSCCRQTPCKIPVSDPNTLDHSTSVMWAG